MKNLFFQIHIHPDIKSLSKFVPTEALPNEMGGKSGHIKDLHAKEMKMLEDNAAFFAIDEKEKRVDESKRTGKAKSAEDLFGVQGVFKKLEID